jgi:oxygen-independent coproporphyrinogen-3 oxidase
VPFCARKCPYCDFNTYAVAQPPEVEYVTAVCREIKRYRDHLGFAGRSVCTVFFGGGTPSMLSVESLGRILEEIDVCFPIDSGAEISLEANPRDASPAFLNGIRAAGFNRVSFGVQSFSDGRLLSLGRDHTAAEARESLEGAVSAGLSNASLDLIFGTPEQTFDELEADIAAATSLPVAHISMYSLTIEPGTPFFQRQERGLLHVPTDDLVAQMLTRIPELLAAQGFARYEISNYSKPGHESKHNSVYWQGGDYLGVGAGAHSYLAHYDHNERILQAERWSTLASPTAYQKAVASDSAVSWRETLDIRGLIFEFFYLGMRMMCGVTEEQFRERFGVELPSGYVERLQRLLSEGYVTCTEGRWSLTAAGFALADSVFEQLADAVVS